MAGRFKQAPLVYVTALLKTSEIPEFTQDQRAVLQQELLKIGLKHRVESIVHELGFQLSITPGENLNSDNVSNKSSPRYGFFNELRTNSLVIGRNSIEWRCTEYNSFEEFLSDFSRAMEKVTTAVESINSLSISECALSYADIIVPKEGRELTEYLSRPILPANNAFELNTGSEESSLYFGQTQSTRIIDNIKRITVTLEQLPVIERKMTKFLPQAMVEKDSKFGMPINLKDDWDNINSDFYALLLTEAASITNNNDLSTFTQTLEDLHNLTRETFKGLLNKTVCNIDWEYEG